jgi:hypothetical protein
VDDHGSADEDCPAAHQFLHHRVEESVGVSGHRHTHHQTGLAPPTHLVRRAVKVRPPSPTSSLAALVGFKPAAAHTHIA